MSVLLRLVLGDGFRPIYQKSLSCILASKGKLHTRKVTPCIQIFCLVRLHVWVIVCKCDIRIHCAGLSGVTRSESHIPDHTQKSICIICHQSWSHTEKQMGGFPKAWYCSLMRTRDNPAKMLVHAPTLCMCNKRCWGWFLQEVTGENECWTWTWCQPAKALCQWTGCGCSLVQGVLKTTSGVNNSHLQQFQECLVFWFLDDTNMPYPAIVFNFVAEKAEENSGQMHPPRKRNTATQRHEAAESKNRSGFRSWCDTGMDILQAGKIALDLVWLLFFLKHASQW